MVTGASRWWGAQSDRGDAARLEAFSGGVLAIAITLLILELRASRRLARVWRRRCVTRCIAPTAAIVLTVVLALMFALGPSPRPAFPAATT